MTRCRGIRAAQTRSSPATTTATARRSPAWRSGTTAPATRSASRRARAGSRAGTWTGDGNSRPVHGVLRMAPGSHGCGRGKSAARSRGRRRQQLLDVSGERRVHGFGHSPRRRRERARGGSRRRARRGQRRRRLLDDLRSAGDLRGRSHGRSDRLLRCDRPLLQPRSRDRGRIPPAQAESDRAGSQRPERRPVGRRGAQLLRNLRGRAPCRGGDRAALVGDPGARGRRRRDRARAGGGRGAVETRSAVRRILGPHRPQPHLRLGSPRRRAGVRASAPARAPASDRRESRPPRPSRPATEDRPG